LADEEVLFVQDLLNDNGKYLTYEDFKQKYGIDINLELYVDHRSEGVST